jgi:hypothetical protein
LPSPFLVVDGFLEGVHDLPADAHPGGVVVGTDGGGVHADQGQVGLLLAGGLSDQAFQ